jgi:hypothetical protein
MLCMYAVSICVPTLINGDDKDEGLSYCTTLLPHLYKTIIVAIAIAIAIAITSNQNDGERDGI